MSQKFEWHTPHKHVVESYAGWNDPYFLDVLVDILNYARMIEAVRTSGSVFFFYVLFYSGKRVLEPRNVFPALFFCRRSLLGDDVFAACLHELLSKAAAILHAPCREGDSCAHPPALLGVLYALFRDVHGDFQLQLGFTRNPHKHELLFRDPHLPLHRCGTLDRVTLRDQSHHSHAVQRNAACKGRRPLKVTRA